MPAVAAAQGPAPTDAQIAETYAGLLPLVSRERIGQDLRAIAAFGSRSAGSPAEKKTIAYVADRLAALGARKIAEKPFSLTAPDPDARGTLAFPGGTATLFPLEPNGVRTNTCDVTGPLLYGGRGSLEELRGKTVDGSVVILEGSGGAAWRNAVKLGAKAVIFLPPREADRAGFEALFSSVPLDAPRFYLPLGGALPVLAAARRAEKARLFADQRWTVVPAANRVWELPGSDPAARRQPVQIMVDAGAGSVVPGLAPGAEEAANPAVMLEMARLWAARPHRRPLRLVLSQGHSRALLGAREFAAGVLDGKLPAPWLALTLDLTGGSRTVGSYSRGWYYEYRNEITDVIRPVSHAFRQHVDQIAKLQGVVPARLVMVDAVNDSDNRTWKNNIPGKFALDCEPFILANIPSLTFATVEDGRPTIDTPFDTVDRVDVANVHRQAQTIFLLLHHSLHDTDSKGELSAHKIPLPAPDPRRSTLIGGYARITGEIVSFDPTKSFIPDTAEPGTLAVMQGRQKTMMGVRGDAITASAGPKAAFRFEGAPTVNAYPATEPPSVTLDAFRVDPKSGRVDMAANWNGPQDAFAPIFTLKTSEKRSSLVVFSCVATNLFDLVDPQELRAIPRIAVTDARTGTLPREFGLFSPTFDQRLAPDIEDAQVLFSKRGDPLVLLGGLGENRLVLTGSRPGEEEGRGRVFSGGTFRHLPEETARDILAINETRLRKFTKYRIVSKGIRDLQATARQELSLAEKARAVRDWPAADRHARAAWGYALRAHPVIQTTANDVVNGVVFYLFLLIPFSYFMERLLVGATLLTKQLGWSIGIFIGSFALLRLIHPAFEIIANPFMIFIAFVMGSLSLVVISFLLGKFESGLREVRATQTGVHEVDVRRGSVAVAAFNLGVGNLRRRKARTILTTLTLTVMTFIVLSFTSVVPELQLNEQAAPFPATYSGILVRNPGLDPLQLATYRQLDNAFGESATVVRRAAYYGADIGDNSVLSLSRGDRTVDVRAMVGFDAGEASVLDPARALLPGGRWFRPGERDAMILPAPVAEALRVTNADVGRAQVTYAGRPYTVVGIADAGALRAITDLDGDGVMPADFTLSRQYQEQTGSGNKAFKSFVRLDPAAVFILPAETAMALGADLRTIAIRFPDPVQTRAALDKLMPRLRLNLYASVAAGGGRSAASGEPTANRKPQTADLEVRQFSVYQGSKSTGLALIIVQMAIAAVFVLNTMVASVVERTKEISIFSSIGLGPNHIAMLFFAESLVYGILGAVIGYFCAQGVAKIIVTTGILPDLTLNFSSTGAVMAAALVMAVVLLSTIYPARKAASIAAPAMNEEAFASEPEGDVWVLPLPFSIDAREAAPLTAFLAEWLRAYEGYTLGEFVTQDTTYYVEGPRTEVESTLWLSPYDLGVSQHLRLEMRPGRAEGVSELELTLTRLSGDPENWPNVNRRFLAAVRGQFLTWRALPKEERAKYREIVTAGVAPKPASMDDTAPLS